MQLFYAPDILQNKFVLNEEESKHCIQVLRHRQDDEINLTDGKGGLYTARITDANVRKCTYTIVDAQPNYHKPAYQLLIAVAPTKNVARFEWFLEKATEIGATDIVPLITQRTERQNLRTDRLEKILVSAMKQCITAYLPTLHPATIFKQLMANTHLLQQYPLRYLPHLNNDAQNPSQHLKNAYTPGSNAMLLIGPEGDFTPDEVKTALDKQFIPITLGKSRLRTETAAIVCCHAIRFMNEQ